MKSHITAALLSSILLFSCNHQHDHNHDHDHDEVKLLITAYSQGFEIFAEADPFVQGKTSEIAAHFTHMDSFKPMQGGSVTMSLVIDGQGIRQTQDTPTRTGIYQFRLHPTSTGTARIFFDVENEGQTLRLEGGTFLVFDDAHEAIHYAEDLLPQHPTAIAFTKEQSWVVDFATQIAKSKLLGTVIKTVGELLPSNDDERLLTAQTSGVVRFINNNLYEGVELQNGEMMFNISGEGLAEGNTMQRFQEARSNYERAKADYERATSLAGAQIVSEKELLLARNEFENAQSVFENLSRNFSEKGQVVRSPIAGNLTHLFVSNGQFVVAGEPLATVVQNKNMIIKAEVQQQYGPQLQQIVSANIAGFGSTSYTLEQLNGKIVSRARNVNPRSHLLPVYLQVNNNPGWITGSLVDVYLYTAGSSAGVVVPNSALIEEQGNYFVMVQLHPESFEKREIKTGLTDGIHTQIVAGLSEGERVVTRGALLVKMAATSAALDPHSGHVH
jgi:membrane fusion protein, heavy metal efflux system